MSGNTLDLIRKEIRQIKAYHVPNPGDMIKLDAMENPYPMPEKLMDQWLALVRTAQINRYPDPAAKKLSKAINAYMGVTKNNSSILGNGSDELIQILAMALAKPGSKILAPAPGFVMYNMIATFVGMEYIAVPLQQNFSLDMDAMLAAISEHQPALIFLAYPNNPTGNLFADEDILAILNAAQGLVVLDEAYHPFACESFMSRLGEFENLLVMRTVSKMGLAGLRLGLLAGPKKLINEFDKIRLPYNINILTQVSAEFAIKHAHVFEDQASIIRQQRDWLLHELSEFFQLKVYPSRANFILVRVLQGSATDIFEALKSHGVLIKNLNSAGGVLENCLRITIGTEQENKQFIKALVLSI